MQRGNHNAKVDGGSSDGPRQNGEKLCLGRLSGEPSILSLAVYLVTPGYYGLVLIVPDFFLMKLITSFTSIVSHV